MEHLLRSIIFANNTGKCIFCIRYLAAISVTCNLSVDIIINEVLFDAEPYGSEFVEIYNRSDKVIDAGLTYIASCDTSNGVIKSMLPIEEKGYMFMPKTYLAITQAKEDIIKRYSVESPELLIENAALPSLPDKWGIVALSLRQGSIIDRFVYNKNMHSPILANTEGISLERIWFDQPTNSASNWYSASQTSGFATPTSKNSQALDQKNTDDGFTILPDVFTPNNDGVDDLATINYKLDQTGMQASITIYNAKGIMMRRLVKNELLGATGVYTWDGSDDQRKAVPEGIYIIHIQLFSAKGELRNLKKTVLLGR